MTCPVEYTIIKAGINQLTKYLVSYFKGKNLRFNTISPGGIWNHQKECSSPEDLLSVIDYLISPGSSCVTRQNLIIDDGFSKLKLILA